MPPYAGRVRHSGTTGRPAGVPTRAMPQDPGAIAAVRQRVWRRSLEWGRISEWRCSSIRPTLRSRTNRDDCG